MMETIRPGAGIEHYYGEDGRGGLQRLVFYVCPKCNKRIKENDIACIECGTFFDWIKKAKVVIREEIEWGNTE